MRRSKAAISKVSRVGITRYLQLYTLLAQELADGTFKPNDALPSEPTLVSRYAVSRTTVRRALARLEREGQIVRRRGSGTFVKQQHERAVLLHRIRELCEPLPPGAGKVTTLQSGKLPVPTALRNRHPELGGNARGARRLYFHERKPFHFESVYLLQPLPEIRRQIESVEQTLAAVTADELAARHLGVSLGSPLIRLRSVFKGAREKLLMVSESFFRSDRCHLHARLERKKGSRAQWLLK